jgi:hypothetical protein
LEGLELKLRLVAISLGLSPSFLLGCEQRPGDAVLISVGAEEDELALDHVLGLEPVLEGPPR